jgi:hypothetical protein
MQMQMQIQNGVRRIMVEMENGDLVSFVPEVLPVVAEVEMTPDPVAEVVTPEPEVVPEPVAEMAPAEVVSEPEGVARYGGRKLKRGEVIVRIEVCAGIITYEKRGGGTFDAAIYKFGTKRSGYSWYQCLWLSKDGRWAFGKPWYASQDKIVNINWF